MGKCRECGTEVSDQAKTCPKCGASKPVIKTSMFVKLLAGFIGLAVIGNIINGLNGSSTSSSPSKVPTEAAVAPTPTVVDPVAERAKNKSDMDQIRERVAENKKKLEKYYPSKQSIAEANEDHLKVTAIALSRGLSKHQEDQKQAAEAKALAGQIAEQVRDMYAQAMEEAFIKNGIDATVKAGGKGKVRLKITYALMSQPLVYKFQNDMEIPGQAKKIGFTTIHYTNGFESSLSKSWTVDL